ncbi:MAG: hypothetical protein Q4G08_08460 [Capnocytophaga sp.]|nr:hypothetical protein [Capnocytophaga sp.]
MKLFLKLPYFALFAFSFFMVSCVSTKQPSFINYKESYCTPPDYIKYHDEKITSNPDSVLVAWSSLKNDYSEQNILIANALGITQELNEMKSLKADFSESARIRKMEIRQKINNRIVKAQSEINSVSAELDCEGERLDQIAKYVDDENSSKMTKLTVASIVLGTASAVAGVFIKNDNWNNGVTIGAGALGAGLGFAMLNPKGVKTELMHQRNLLRAIWEDKNTNHSFPSFVWYMLNERHFSNLGDYSLIHNVRERWINYQFGGDEKSAKKSVIFSTGGAYLAADLHARSQMIKQMQAVVRSLNQNLDFLITEIDKNEG